MFRISCFEFRILFIFGMLKKKFILFALFIFKCLRICLNAPDKFSQIFSLGLTTWIGAQIFLNIGSMLSVVPLTGVPLPFFSYGGSSLTMILIATGILLNISKYESKTG